MGVRKIIVRELLIGLGFSLDESKLKKADQGISNIKNHAETAFDALGKMAAVVGLALGVNEIVEMGDAWTNVNARIRLVTKSSAEQAEMQEKVYDIAQKTRQEFGATGDLFFKLSQSAEQLGATSQNVLDVTETVNKALVIGGASTQEAKATILQLSQALASGRLQGDELRSLGENASMLMREVAKYYGVTIGQLKKMGAEGELTAEGVLNAILKAKAKMDREFEKMPVTVEQGVTYAINRIGKLIFGINKETSVFQYVAKGIMRSADGVAGSVEKGSNALGGFRSAVKLLILTLASLQVAMFVFKYPVTYLPRIIVMLRNMALGIAAVSRAAWSLILNPLFWEAALIAAAILLIALALEDIYYWITGGESVLGDWLGTWEDFKVKVVKWMGEVSDGIIGGVKRAAQFWKDVFGGLRDWTLNMFKEIRDNFPSWKLGAGVAVPAFLGGVKPGDMVRGNGGGPVVINVNGDTRIEQNIAGAGPALARDVGNATATAANDSMDRFARDLDNVIWAY